MVSCIGLLTLLGLLAATPGFAQSADGRTEIANDGLQTSMSRERIEARIQELSTQGTRSPAQTRELELFRQADAALRSAELSRSKIRSIRDSIDVFPQERRAKNNPISIPKTFADLGIASSASREELEQHLTKARSSEAASLARRAAIERQLANLRELPRQARQELEKKRAEAAEAESALTSSPSSENASEFTDAERISREARLEALSAAAALLNQELLSQDTRYKRLLKVQDRLKQSTQATQATVKLISARLIDRRQEEATLTKALAEQTRQDVLGKHPALVALAEGNAKLTRRLDGLIRDEARVLNEARSVSHQTEQLEADLKRFEQRLEIAGLNRILGKLFIERRQRLQEGHLDTVITDAALEQSIVDSTLR